MKRIESMPGGLNNLICESCGARYEYWNGSVSLAGMPDSDPICPQCGDANWRLFVGSVPCIIGWNGKITKDHWGRSEAIAHALRFQGENVTASDVAQEFGKYFQREGGYE